MEGRLGGSCSRDERAPVGSSLSAGQKMVPEMVTSTPDFFLKFATSFDPDSYQ